MALWRDPLDDLIADLKRSLPAAPPSNGLDYSRQLIEMQLAIAEIMRTSPRIPFATDLGNNTRRQSANHDQQVPGLPFRSSPKTEE